MKNHHISSAKAALYFSAAPAVFNLVFCLVENTFRCMSSLPIQEHQEQFLNSSSPSWILQLKDISAGIYTTYGQFLATMLFLHLSIKAVLLTAQNLSLKKQPHKQYTDNHVSSNDLLNSTPTKGQDLSLPEKLREVCRCIVLLVLLYSSIYYLLQAVWICIGFFHHGYIAALHYQDNPIINSYEEDKTLYRRQPLGNLTQLPEIHHGVISQRVLFEATSSKLEQQIYSMPLLNIQSLVLSNDKMTMFAVTQDQVISIDVSNPMSPKIINSINIDVTDNKVVTITWNPVLSPDGQILAFGVPGTLHLLNLSDSSPTNSITEIKYFNYIDPLEYLDNIVFSPDSETIYSHVSTLR